MTVFRYPLTETNHGYEPWIMISARLEHFLDRPLAPLVKRFPVNPNLLTITGFLITTVAALTILYNIRLAGVLILVGGFFDMLDGVMARTNGRVTRFGAFLDSVLDRYSDAVLFIGITVYYLRPMSKAGVFLSLGSLVGAFLISYARARAEAIGRDCHVGLLERAERIILLSVGCLTGWLLPILWGLFVLSHITVIQRVYHTWKATQGNQNGR